MLRSRKIALAVVGCFSRCCAPSLWNRAILCNSSEVPQEIPREITFPNGFFCGDGCPLSGSRIIIYRGWCYTVESGAGTVECQGTRAAPRTYISPYFGATVVTWSELSCKPLTATCADDSCAPIEPGCCTAPVAGPCSTPCQLPKRFMVTHVAQYRWRSNVYADAGSCSGLYTCEEAFTSVDAWAEYACDENNVGGNGESQAILVRSGGTITLSGHNLTPEGNDINGTYTPYADPIYRGLKTAVGFGFSIPLRNLFFCGGDHRYSNPDPPGCATSTNNCFEGVRRIRTETVRCDYWTLDQTSYEDCFLFDDSFSSRGVSSPPCGPDVRWDDTREVRMRLTIIAGCENDPPWRPEPTGPERPYPYPVAATSTAEMLGGMA